MMYGWTKQFLTRDGEPWLPVMGEFHFARYPRDRWREEIAKMKAAGVDIVATYVFWLHHEPEQGRFDFEGQRSLRAFLQEIADAGLTAWVRIGPWCHGEARHGGFPDWLKEKPFELRSNDEAYLSLVRAYWTRVFLEVDGHLYKQGGPVIGTQIENEYGHCGGSGGDEHMDRLYALAREIGFDTPYYTATGWGGAKIGGMLPVMACYCDAPWAAGIKPLPPNSNYIFSHERNDVDVGSDFKLGENLAFDATRYPYLLAEMGGAIGSTWHRRPRASAADIGAMSLTKLGSGANLLGYYMFHGGTNPGYNLNETRDSGSWCETSELSYDKHAPIGEYGRIGDNLREIKLLAYFLRDFGAELATLPTHIPEDGAKLPSDTRSLRYALRRDGRRGYLFVNNHQRRLALPARTEEFCVELEEETIRFPAHDLPEDMYAFYPFNMPVGDATLKSALATPLCRLNDETYVFYADGDPAYVIDGELGDAQIATISRKDALNAWRVEKDGREALVICEAPVIQCDGVYAIIRADAEWRMIPQGLGGEVSIPDDAPRVEAKLISRNYLLHEYELTIDYAGDPAESYLRITYAGGMAELYVDGVKRADDFYDGSVWEVGLSRIGRPDKAVLRVYALLEGAQVYLDYPPEMRGGHALRLEDVEIQNEYRVALF